MLAWGWAGLGPGELVTRGVPVASRGGLARAVRARLAVSDLADGDPRFYEERVHVPPLTAASAQGAADW
eukprot:7562537-Alexandrium_andersonii.AAC.1